MDWARGASGLYNQAVANTRLVGAMTARLAAQLIEVGHVPVRRMHAIGHSLGAHISGYIGSQLRTKYGYTLRRITGKPIINFVFSIFQRQMLKKKNRRQALQPPMKRFCVRREFFSALTL